MTLVVFGAYALGAFVGLLATRHTRLALRWPGFVRAQLVVVSVLLSITSVWRIDSVADIAWPLLIVVGIAGILLVAGLTTKGKQRAGRAALHAWAATPNTGFFLIPVTAALGGPNAASAAVLVDRLATPLWSLFVWMLRRDAPRPQRPRTSAIDQAPLIAVGVGVLLHLAGPAPQWTAVVTLVAAPMMAVTGAAVFIGSALHPSQRLDPRPGAGTWLTLLATRIALIVPLAVLAPSRSLAVLAILAAFSIPAFGPAQMSTVYGYSDSVVAASNTYGWLVGGLGICIALIIGN